jgi:type IV pilus modification protein PilV
MVFGTNNMNSFGKYEHRRVARRQSGMGLIELMISMFILAVGLVGILGIILAAMTSNNRNKSDTGATFVAQLLMEQIAAAPSTTSTLSLTDSCGTARSLTLTSGSGAALYTTSSAPTSSLVNTIDWTETTPAAGYQTYWCLQDANGIQQDFDVRWNIQDMTSSMSNQTRLVTVGARPKAARATEIRRFAMPATLRMISTY